MIKYQLLYAPFDQISDHKYDIYGNQSTKLLEQAANKNSKFMFTKTGRLGSYYQEKFQTDTSEV